MAPVCSILTLRGQTRVVLGARPGGYAVLGAGDGVTTFTPAAGLASWAVAGEETDAGRLRAWLRRARAAGELVRRVSGDELDLTALEGAVARLAVREAVREAVATPLALAPAEELFENPLSARHGGG